MKNATDGLKAATFSAPDLIILDLNLPDLHGSEVLERIRSWSNVPVIILSIVSSEDEKVRLLQQKAERKVGKRRVRLERAEARLTKQVRQVAVVQERIGQRRRMPVRLDDECRAVVAATLREVCVGSSSWCCPATLRSRSTAP